MRLTLLVLAVVLGVSAARWVRPRRGRADPPRDSSFVGTATNELSTAIFQGYIDDEKNIAFSPFGYSAILAILAEGAQGETRDQLVSALHLPEDPNLARKTYRFIMERLNNTHEYKYNQPELKNFFYIYENYTINEDYKKILEDFYLTQVRSVEMYNPESHFKTNEHESEEKTEFNVDLPEKKPEDVNDIPELVPPKESQGQLISFAVEDIPEKIEKPAKNIKEKIKLVKTSSKKEEFGDEEETMVAVEARNHQARTLRILEDKNDITSSISVNSVGKKSNKATTHPLMLIFNGMYFRGSWKKSWDLVEPGTFYKSNTEKKQVPMMKTTGKFKTGSLPGLDSTAIELPYDGGRYSLLVVVPRARDGLTRLIADLPAAPLPDIQDNLHEELLAVSMPTFYAETTTKPIAALAKFGVSSIFSREAELSGISQTEGLFVQELVQHVAVRVDNADSSASQMSASNPVMESLKTLHEIPPTRFSVEHPFLFFIIDRLDNLIMVAGKIVDPKQPTAFD